MALLQMLEANAAVVRRLLDTESFINATMRVGSLWLGCLPTHKFNTEMCFPGTPVEIVTAVTVHVSAAPPTCCCGAASHLLRYSGKRCTRISEPLSSQNLTYLKPLAARTPQVCAWTCFTASVLTSVFLPTWPLTIKWRLPTEIVAIKWRLAGG
jgi:hypothetical protein